MRRRTTITILAVTLASASTACGGASESVDRPTRQELAGQPADTGEASDETSAPSASDQATAPSPGAPQDPKPEPAACDLDALNQELGNTMLESALQRHEQFRCLCDDKGYPLVGNINAKGTKASQFCPALKEKGLL